MENSPAKRRRLIAPKILPRMDQSPAPGEKWQSSVRRDMRKRVIMKILDGIHPASDYYSAMNNPQYVRLVRFIRRIEADLFRTCTSKDEYFAKLQDKYQLIVHKLSERIDPAKPKEMDSMAPPKRPFDLPNPFSPDPQPMDTGSRGVDPTSVPSPSVSHHKHSGIGLGMDFAIPDKEMTLKDIALEEAIPLFIHVLVHSSQCRDKHCESPSCGRMKRIMHHILRLQCKKCNECKRVISICLNHAKACKSSNCPVPLCETFKQHMLSAGDAETTKSSVQESQGATCM